MWPHVGCYLSLWDGKNRLNLPVRVDVLVKVGTRGESSALFKCAAKRTSCGVTNMQGNGINGKTIEDKLLRLSRTCVHAPFLEDFAGFCHKRALDSAWGSMNELCLFVQCTRIPRIIIQYFRNLS